MMVALQEPEEGRIPFSHGGGLGARPQHEGLRVLLHPAFLSNCILLLLVALTFLSQYVMYSL